MEIPVLLQQLRRDADLTQSQVAARAGTSQAAVARYGTGVVSPSVATLHRLTHACGALLEINVTATPRTDLSGLYLLRYLPLLGGVHVALWWERFRSS
jgi:transcriptional regulator with XRE-family HTH domain